MQTAEITIAVFVVTYRRHEMLRRALSSVLAQTHSNIVVKVVNDDPDDAEVGRIVDEQADARVRLFRPVERRGATRNFNLMFQDAEASFVSLLEDDNWWEPSFLAEMLRPLVESDHDLIVGNERIWRELPDGGWADTGRTLVDFRDVRTSSLRPEDICGSARLCNSAMLVRIRPDRNFCTPETIPVDVTEHFRERLFGREVLFLGNPLVNYAETLSTARSTRGDRWSALQYILIGSVFVAANGRRARTELARRLWADCPSATSPRAVTLIGAGLAIREARVLLRVAPKAAIARFAASLVKSPGKIVTSMRCRAAHEQELDFLVKARLTRELVHDLDSPTHRGG